MEHNETEFKPFRDARVPQAAIQLTKLYDWRPIKIDAQALKPLLLGMGMPEQHADREARGGFTLDNGLCFIGHTDGGVSIRIEGSCPAYRCERRKVLDLTSKLILRRLGNTNLARLLFLETCKRGEDSRVYIHSARLAVSHHGVATAEKEIGVVFRLSLFARWGENKQFHACGQGSHSRLMVRQPVPNIDVPIVFRPRHEDHTRYPDGPREHDGVDDWELHKNRYRQNQEETNQQIDYVVSTMEALLRPYAAHLLVLHGCTPEQAYSRLYDYDNPPIIKPKPKGWKAPPKKKENAKAHRSRRRSPGPKRPQPGPSSRE